MWKEANKHHATTSYTEIGGTSSQISQEWLLTWKNLSVTKKKSLTKNFWYNAEHTKVKILSDVSGAVKSGTLLAVMGASGAGKTTMLAAISRREVNDSLGTLLLNGQHISSSEMAECSGFAPQADIFFEELTVAEHMSFMANLKMDRHLSASTRIKRVVKLLHDFGITNCANTRIKSLSGGERKRVTICVELLNDPPILFCDEPTTGLDSWAAFSTVSMLRDLAEAGKMVICTVHQPASGLFDFFHDVVLLANGRVAFHGPTSEAASFFNSLSLQCPVGFNQAEYYISQLSIAAGKERESVMRITRICFEYTVSNYSKKMQSFIEDVQAFPKDNHDCNGCVKLFDNGVPPIHRILRPGWFVQFIWLSWRLYIVTKRSLYTLALDFVLFMVIAVVIAVPYINIAATKDQKDIQNIEGLLYLTITEAVFTHIYQVITIFPLELPILLRESANRLYKPSAYYLSKMVYFIPIAAFNSIFYTLIIFCVSGVNGGFFNYMTFLTPVFITSIASSAYGAALSASFESIDSCFLLSVPIEVIGVMFSGIYLSIPSAPAYIKWLKYFSIWNYGIEALSILQWRDVDNIQCSEVKDVPCIQNGTQVLNNYGYSVLNVYYDYIGLIVIYIVCHLIGAFMVFRRSKKQSVY